MIEQVPSHDSQKQDFFDKPKNIRWMLRALYIICGLLFIADFLVHRHVYVYFESLPAFYPLYGFGACLVLVFIAKFLRHVVMRDANYYEAVEEPGDNSQKNVKEAE